MEIQQIVQEGYQILFLSSLPVQTLKSMRDPVLAPKDMEALDQEVSDLLQKGSIELARGLGFTSHLFCIPKKDGDLQPVLNLKPLNRFVQPQAFKMETIKVVCQLISKNDFLTSLDLQDVFHHILIHPASHRFLQFQWWGKTYQFWVLPFGLSLVPWVFTKVLQPLLQWARSQGICLMAYLDDLLITAATRELSIRHTAMVKAKLEELGYLIKMSKSQLEPTQMIKHLGYLINTQNMTLSVPTNKI